MRRRNWLLALLWISAVALVGCNDPSSWDNDPLSGAVHDQLEAKLNPCSRLQVLISKRYEPTFWEPRFKSEQSNINGVRIWAKKLSDKRIAGSYVEWLDFYQRELNDARKEVNDRSIANAYIRSHQIPELP